MTETEKKLLEETRISSLNHIRSILPFIKSLEKELAELKNEYKDYKDNYESADHALAEADGRLQKVTIGTHGRRTPQFNLEQIKRIAKKLGIEL